MLVFLWLLVALTLLPLWQTDLWWVRLWDFPKLQLAALLLVALLLLPLASKRRGPGFWASMASGTAALVWQVTHFAAFIPSMPRDMASADNCPEGRELSLLNVNVLQDNRRYGELLQLVDRVNPDIVLLLETDRRWAAAVTPLNRVFPYRIGEARPNTYGMLLFSKLPMEARVLHRVQPDIPSVAARLRLRDGSTIDFHGVHPEPPLPGDDSGERDAELVMVGRDVRRGGGAAIVMGDLNDVAWSRTSRLFRQVAAVADPRVGRGFYPTYHADYPFARWPLDHLFATPHFRLLGMERFGDIGSDHFPIVYRLCLVRAPARRLAPPFAKEETARDANEEIREGLREQESESRTGE